MVEGGALEISEAEVLEALKVAQKGIKELVKLVEQLVKKEGQPKMRGRRRRPTLSSRPRCASSPRRA
jgi:polyribonucleotide nucleotidyltransferase